MTAFYKKFTDASYKKSWITFTGSRFPTHAARIPSPGRLPDDQGPRVITAYNTQDTRVFCAKDEYRKISKNFENTADPRRARLPQTSSRRITGRSNRMR